jgi:hypothetical protein
MAPRSKRTYNLSPATIVQVKELAARYGVASSQDAVVELAVERLYRERLERQEEAAWASAAEDPAFRSESQTLAAVYRDRGTWPK